MGRIVAILLIVLAPAAAAQSVTVRSGEHPGFSRLVLDFPSVPKWQFGRTAEGYELRFDPSAGRPDPSGVFRTMPRQRIRAVDGPAPGRLSLRVDCPCSANVFEIGTGRLVIDIADGPPAGQGRFERFLDAPGQTRPALPRPPADPVITGPVSVLPPVSPVRSRAKVDVAPVRLPTEWAGPAGPGPLPEPQATPAPAPVVEAGSRGAKEPNSGAQRVARIPARWDAPDLPVPLEPESPRIRAAEEELVRELMRAAAQGLIEVPTTPLGRLGHFGSSDAGATIAPGAVPTPETARPEPNLRIETAADRDALRPGGAPLNRDGRPCPPEGFFDFMAEGQEGDPTRAKPLPGMIGEFDRPLPDAVRRNVTRYLSLGFGAEAVAVLDELGAGVQDAPVLRALAFIVDSRKGEELDVLAGQENCPTAAAMWSVLAATDHRGGTAPDAAAIVRSFSALPPHLRDNLGPRLADRLIRAGDVDTATTIRDLIERGGPKDRPETRIVDAGLATAAGDPDRAAAELRPVASANSPLSPLALAELIETSLGAGLPVAAEDALAAEALAVEHRGTAMGRRLTVASIRALAGGLEPAALFARIDLARRTAGLNETELRDLTILAHRRNLDSGTDFDFVANVLSFPPPAEAGAGDDAPLIGAIALRLARLGFATEAEALLATATGLPDADRRRLSARLALLGGEPDRAERIVDGITGTEAGEIRALAAEQRGAHARAARLFAALDRRSAQARAAWLAGDWQQVAEIRDSPWSRAAALVAAGQGSPADPRTEAAEGAGPDASPTTATDAATARPVPTLAEARALLDASRRSRDVLDEMFAEIGIDPN